MESDTAEELGRTLGQPLTASALPTEAPADLGVPRASRLERLVQAVLALIAWATLAVAWSLQPSSDGLGTHRQLGFAPCTFYQLTGRPCPGCGLTTAFAHMAHGRPLQALIVQPFGALLFLMVLAGAVGLAAFALRGRSVLPLLYRPNMPLALYGMIGLWLAAWTFKIVYGQVTGHYSP